MTKSLEQIQKENRKFILEAIHGCSYEEALKKELGFGCKVKIKRFISSKDFNEEIFVIDNYCDFSTENLFRTIGSFHHNEITEIIGKPLTLSRVLLAIYKHEYYEDILFDYSSVYLKGVSFDLTKETLEEQTEETQRGINDFLQSINEFWYNENSSIVGKKLRSVRLENKITVTGLSRDIGVSIQLLHAYEREARSPSAKIAQQLSKFLNKPIKYFYTHD